jgi:hypothetical protein
MWALDCPQAAGAQRLRLEGLSPETQLIVVLRDSGGSASPQVLSGASEYVLSWRGHRSLLRTALDYGALGVWHVVTGLDHLLFMLALVLMRPALRPLVRIATVFTLGHSATLALAATGRIAIDAALAEPAIALTLIVAARELCLRSADRGASLLRWEATALVFGLIHGLGFAGALEEMGIPTGQAIPALAAFNVGVEVGQIAVIGAALVVLRILTLRPATALLSRAVPHVVGAAGVYWCFVRL